MISDMAPLPTQEQVLEADYRSESGAEAFRHPLGPIEANAPTAERVEYLGGLRSAVTALQEEINTFLTRKMDEDKTSSAKAAALDDRQEEENYGEEVVDEA